jgi:hypothetical protein
MANIKDKDLNDLSGWNAKELRKLKINIKNRLQSFSGFSKPKELQKSHPLVELGEFELKELLAEIARAEKKLREA